MIFSITMYAPKKQTPFALSRSLFFPCPLPTKARRLLQLQRVHFALIPNTQSPGVIVHVAMYLWAVMPPTVPLACLSNSCRRWGEGGQEIVGFEPAQLSLVELESTPLDHSGKLSGSSLRLQAEPPSAQIQLQRMHDPGRPRACNLWFRRPTPYPLGHRATDRRVTRICFTRACARCAWF